MTSMKASSVSSSSKGLCDWGSFDLEESDSENTA